jgi:hypothetical protein
VPARSSLEFVSFSRLTNRRRVAREELEANHHHRFRFSQLVCCLWSVLSHILARVGPAFSHPFRLFKSSIRLKRGWRPRGLMGSSAQRRFTGPCLDHFPFLRDAHYASSWHSRFMDGLVRYPPSFSRLNTFKHAPRHPVGFQPSLHAQRFTNPSITTLCHRQGSVSHVLHPLAIPNVIRSPFRLTGERLWYKEVQNSSSKSSQ